MRKYFYIILNILLVLLTSCETNQSQTVPSSVAKLTAFSFAAVDSMPGLGKAVFTVDERLDTGLVWNKDSMLYGTDLHHVVPKFVFAATPGMAALRLGDTTCTLTGYDTLDFTQSPVYLTVRSADRSNTKVYEIIPTVHQVDPDLYAWTQLTAGIYPPDDSEQRVVEQGDAFVMLCSNGFELHAYRSTDGAVWSDAGTPAGLPAGTNVRQIISDGTTLYYGQGQTVYTSSDAVTWTAHSVDAEVRTMLVWWNGKVWALLDRTNGYELAHYDGGTLQPTGLKPEGEFPVSDFATVCFLSPSGRERAMIIGGFAENGRSLNTRWNLEYAQFMGEGEGEYRLEEFSIDRPQFTSLTGSSVVSYNGQLQLFGGIDGSVTYLGSDVMLSNDEGLNWSKADSTKYNLPATCRTRQKQTAIVRGNYIYLFGGQDARTTYSDVYRGRLNSIDWEK